MGELRSVIADARRIVVKIGSSSLTGSDGRLSVALVTALADVLAAERKTGRQIVLVTSGAIAAGI
ncbi:MAG TPA: glutamate 5-kinase, partial [Demequina sp.]|nr:glutamate 5-kinase [Demequina sp.]